MIFPLLSVMENLDLGAYLRKDKDGIKQDIDRVFELFPVLRERSNQAGGTLSGGEQQMLAIGRALMARPKLLLLDEPSLGLAPILVDAIFEIIRQINNQGTTILLVEQNAQLALQFSNRGYVIETGEIALADQSAELLKNEHMISKQIVSTILKASASIRNTSGHVQLSRKNIDLADRFEFLLSLIASNDVPSNRTPNVPRTI